MDGLQARLDSFRKSKRVKNPKKTSSATLKWPHPINFIANPESLADAGFYYDPSYDDPDNVTCFNCEKQLAGWEDDDNPHLIHWDKCAQTCCWAFLQCGLILDKDSSGRFAFPDKTRVPNHKSMEKVRLESFTFGKGWVHDETRNHGANSKSMARAGFVYTPQVTGDDLASCLYCNVSLSGWDEDDDPMEEHRKRAAKYDPICPLFGNAEGQTKPPTNKPPSKSTSKPPSRTTSRTKYQEMTAPTKTFDGEMEEDSDAPKKSRSTTITKTPSKSRSKSSAKTPRNKSRSASRSGLTDVGEEDELEPPPTVKKRTRSTSKSVAESGRETPPDIERPIEAPATVKKRSRSKSVARSETVVKSDGEDEVVTNTVRKASRSRAKSKAPLEVPVDGEPATVRKSSRSKSKVAPDVKGDDVLQLRKTSRKSSKQDAVEGDEVEEGSVTNTATSKKKSKPKVGSPSQPVNLEAKDLFNDDIVVMDEYLPPPTSPLHVEPSTIISNPASNIDTDTTLINTTNTTNTAAAITSTTTTTDTDAIYLPALSRLPFMPLQTLSDAELEMTVEEWIRYQIEVEQDRFKRDGERELERFKKRAEEVRKAIEEL